jgi:hypothetical protein
MGLRVTEIDEEEVVEASSVALVWEAGECVLVGVVSR